MINNVKYTFFAVKYSCIVVGTVMGCKIGKMKKDHTKEHSAT